MKKAAAEVSPSNSDAVMTIRAVSLRDRIVEVMNDMTGKRPPEVVAGMLDEIEALAGSGAAKGAPQVGTLAPDFSLPDANRRAAVSLSSLLGNGPAIVAFYRGGWCPFCDLQLRAYQGILGEIQREGAELVAISPQTAAYAFEDARKKALGFPVLSDVHNYVARRYGLVYTLSDAMKELLVRLDNPLPKFNGDTTWELPVPATFVIDQGGRVRLAHVEPDYTHRLEPAALLEAVRLARA